ncbi:transposase [Streptomyces sp. NBC_00237]|nr:transposase [Streptomyces sp. NBC_00237]
MRRRDAVDHAKAARVRLLANAVRIESLTVLSRFRTDFYDCLNARANVLFELTDAVLCMVGPVRSLVDPALAPEHRRGHGALCAGLHRGRLDVTRLRRALAALEMAAGLPQLFLGA